MILHCHARAVSAWQGIGFGYATSEVHIHTGYYGAHTCRLFWTSRYKEIKHLNPRFPFMIRPNGGGEPYILFEFGALGSPIAWRRQAWLLRLL